MTIVDDATAVNITFGSPENEQICINAMIQMYRTVQIERNYVLLVLSPDDCRWVGVAFTAMTFAFNNGNPYINEVAAENAFFCLAKAHIKQSNPWFLPPLFTLLHKRPKFFERNFINFWIKETSVRRGRVMHPSVIGDHYRDPRLQDFRDEAISLMEHVKYYLLSLFYDINNRKFNIPTDLPYFLPIESDITYFLEKTISLEDFNEPDFITLGKIYFEKVFGLCQHAFQYLDNKAMPNLSNQI